MPGQILTKDSIRGISEVVSDILTEINRADLSSRTEEYVALEKSIKDVNKSLDKLKKEVAKCVLLCARCHVEVHEK